MSPCCAKAGSDDVELFHAGFTFKGWIGHRKYGVPAAG
jgi:hypothetical protein